MTNYFFINDKGNQVGPINKEELINKGIKKDTLIWYKGIMDWTTAEKLEELNFLFFKKLFRQIQEDEITRLVQIKPQWQYSLRKWFLYEWLMKNFVITFLFTVISFLPNRILAQTINSVSDKSNYSTEVKPIINSSTDFIKIGTQIWSKKNLDVTHFQNGEIIPQASNQEQWNQFLNEGKAAWCYNNFKESESGKIYNFFALVDERGLVPKGWRIPDDNDVEILSRFLGFYESSQADNTKPFESIISVGEKIELHPSLSPLIGTNTLGLNLQKSVIATFNDNKEIQFVPRITFWGILKPLSDAEFIQSKNIMKEYNQEMSIFRKERATLWMVIPNTIKSIHNNIYIYKDIRQNIYRVGAPVRCIQNAELYDMQFADGRVYKNNKWGLINSEGELITPLIYDEIYPSIDAIPNHFVRGVKINGKEGWLENGKEIIKPIYEDINIKRTIRGTEIHVKKNGITKIYNSPESINEDDFIIQAAVKNDVSLIEGRGSVAKATENSNQSLEYDFSEIKSQGCDVIKSEFKQFAIKFISYKKRVKSNPYSLRLREDEYWNNNLSKFSDLATTCAIKLKGEYALEVLAYMEKVSSLLPISPVVSSSNKNKSSVQNNSTTSTSQSKSAQTSNTVVKKVDQAAGFENAQSSTSIGGCRFTGPQPGKGVSLSIGSDVQLYHNGSFKVTTIGGGVDYYTGNGDVWIIYKNPKARTKYNFKTSNGKVQICDSY